MNKKLITAAKIIAFAGAFSLTGCAVITMTANMHYKVPQGTGAIVSATTSEHSHHPRPAAAVLELGKVGTSVA